MTPSQLNASPSVVDGNGNGERSSNEGKLDTKISASSDPWSISVKTVGGGIGATDGDDGNMPDMSGERQFTVQVSPDDDLERLYDQIEASTGLKASQQRLIYRGRLIGPQSSLSSGSSPPVAAAAPSSNKQTDREDSSPSPGHESSHVKIRDIAGLSDGHTIHLVKRRETETPSNEGSGSSLSSASANNQSDGDILSGTSGGGGLLAAFLGLSSMNEDADSSSPGNGGRGQRWGLRGSRSPSIDGGGRLASRANYRMTAEDRQAPDPGSMEPVRQGLMTLHTLLPHLEPSSNNTGENGEELSTETSPLASNREWYRGQWLDVLDTVNQWLEATIVEIVNPEDIIPPNRNASDAPGRCDVSTARPRRRDPHLSCDPAVSASDLEGRRRLLLEPCDSRSDENDLGGDLAGFRPRASNHGVQLLLIHYNGWPHRWDEWIRSDSERLRLFRTRTRHPNVSSTVSPAPQSVFHESPRTNILPHGDDTEDRMALLPELARAMAAVNGILQRQVTAATGVAPAVLLPPHNLPTAMTESSMVTSGLPWISQQADPEPVQPDDLVEPSTGEETSNIIRPVEYFDSDDEGGELMDWNLPEDLPSRPISAATAMPSLSHPLYNRRELQNLATLLDRLGRTLTDAAPHIAALADNLPQNEMSQRLEQVLEDDSYEEALEQALEEIAESMPGSDVSPTETPIGGLLSLWSRERRRNSNRSIRGSRRSFSTSNRGQHSPSTATPSAFTIDPDHEDYVSGLVNTNRGEVRAGPRSRSSQDDVASLLGAYLAAATLSGSGSGDGEDGGLVAGGIGQLLRAGTGGRGNGGIDIHIHAVVTTPGMPPGAVGIAALGGGDGGVGGGGSPAGGTVLGVTRDLFPSARRANSTNSILRPSRGSSTSLLSSRRRVHSQDDDEDAGLFAELYSETPEPIDPNGSPPPGERGSIRRASLPNMDIGSRSGGSGDYVTGLRNTYYGSLRRELESPSDFLARIHQHASLDHTNVGAATIAGRSSTRRRSVRRSLRRETADDAASSIESNNSPPRRNSGWGRLFRRRGSSREDS